MWWQFALYGLLAGEAPVAATVCELLEHPQRYQGKLVSVRAEVQVWSETSALRDGQCEKGLWFEMNDDAQGWKAVERRLKGPDHRWKVTVTAIGRFETGDCFGHQCYGRSQLRVARFVNAA